MICAYNSKVDTFQCEGNFELLSAFSPFSMDSSESDSDSEAQGIAGGNFSDSSDDSSDEQLLGAVIAALDESDAGGSDDGDSDDGDSDGADKSSDESDDGSSLVQRKAAAQAPPPVVQALPVPRATHGGAQRVPPPLRAALQGAQRLPRGVQAARRGAQRVPHGVQAARRGAQRVPRGVQAARRGAQRVPRGMQAAPPAVQAAPPAVQAAPPVVQAAPPGAQAAAPGTQAAPPAVQAAPPGPHAAAPGTQAAPPAVQAAPPGPHAAAPGTQAAPPADQWNWSIDPATRRANAAPFQPVRPPGFYLPNNARPQDLDPASLFFLFWNEANSVIIDNTNERGRTHEADWKDVDIFEMQKFIAILIGMDLVEKPVMKDYWAKDGLNVPCFAVIMSRDRFMSIYRSLRFADAAAAIRNGTGIKRSPNYDPLHKIRPIINAVLYASGNLRQPDRNMSIDEQLVKFRGRFKWRQVCQLGLRHAAKSSLFHSFRCIYIFSAHTLQAEKHGN